MKIVQQPSPNFGERRLAATPDLIVLHYTAKTSCRAALEWLCDPNSQVSAHYLISPNSDVTQMVDEKDRAWHAGAGSWGDCVDVNSRSIGIELSNDGFSPFAAAQIVALELLLADIMTRWSIPPERVIGHSDMAISRKVDPGRRFDWRRLARSGLSIWPAEIATALAPDYQRFLQEAARFGYGTGSETGSELEAFRLRFRPGVRGPIDSVDMTMVADLANRFPAR